MHPPARGCMSHVETGAWRLLSDRSDSGAPRAGSAVTRGSCSSVVLTAGDGDGWRRKHAVAGKEKGAVSPLAHTAGGLGIQAVGRTTQDSAAGAATRRAGAVAVIVRVEMMAVLTAVRLSAYQLTNLSMRALACKSNSSQLHAVAASPLHAPRTRPTHTKDGSDNAVHSACTGAQPGRSHPASGRRRRWGGHPRARAVWRPRSGPSTTSANG